MMKLTPVGAGENAVTFYLPEPLSDHYPAILNGLAKTAIANGAIDAVPAYNSVLVVFDPSKQSADDFLTVLHHALPSLTEHANNHAQQRIIRVPVCYEGEFALDLSEVGAKHGLSHEAVINQHLADTYTVCCLGFVPGFAFLGYVDDCIATPRRANPRPLVAGGSVGIAGKQTGFYPVDAPGGWNIIGRTPKTLYAPEKELFSCFEMGDTVQFYRISEAEFHAWSES